MTPSGQISSLLHKKASNVSGWLKHYRRRQLPIKRPLPDNAFLCVDILNALCIKPSPAGIIGYAEPLHRIRINDVAGFSCPHPSLDVILNVRKGLMLWSVYFTLLNWSISLATVLGTQAIGVEP
jgi:hypothetical protein